jgi:hypothetical protein
MLHGHTHTKNKEQATGTNHLLQEFADSVSNKKDGCILSCLGHEFFSRIDTNRGSGFMIGVSLFRLHIWL